MTKRRELPLSRLGQAMFNSHLDSYQFMVQRFPRLVRRMQWAAVLSSSEAGCALRDYVYARDTAYNHATGEDCLFYCIMLRDRM
jgi:hypothetical protein